MEKKNSPRESISKFKGGERGFFQVTNIYINQLLNIFFIHLVMSLTKSVERIPFAKALY